MKILTLLLALFAGPVVAGEFSKDDLRGLLGKMVEAEEVKKSPGGHVMTLTFPSLTEKYSIIATKGVLGVEIHQWTYLEHFPAQEIDPSRWVIKTYLDFDGDGTAEYCENLGPRIITAGISNPEDERRCQEALDDALYELKNFLSQG
jgi:hypothetical protein